MADYRALAQALDPYAIDTGTPDAIKMFQSGYKLPNFLGMTASQPTPQEIERMAAEQSPAFGVFPQMKPYRSQQDITASANVPVDLLRGRVAGTRGLFGDVVNQPIPMVRPLQLLSQAFTGQQKYPDTEHYLETMPLKSNTPIGDVAGKIGSFAPINPMPAVKGYLSLLGNEINAGMTGQPTRSIIGQITPKPLQLDVYHGTPHTLPPTERNPLGEFDASKIGTGEGAQAYGHGIYTAENPKVAIEYKKALSTPEVVLKDGTRITNPQTGSPEDVAKAWLEEAYLNGDKTPFDTAIKKVAMLRNSANSPQQFDGALNVLNEWKKSGASVDLGGNLYKADLPDEMIPKMLDWDKPLSQQPDILEVLKKNYRSDYLDMFKNKPGSDFYKAISGNEGTEDLRVLGSSELRNMGIPGIKYLDEGSRRPGVTSMTQAQLDTRIDILKKDIDSGLGNQDRMKQILSSLEQERASHPKLTHNFVVFPGEEQNIKILERNAEKTTK